MSAFSQTGRLKASNPTSTSQALNHGVFNNLILFATRAHKVKLNGTICCCFFLLLLYSFFLKCLNKNIDSDRNVCHARCVCRTFFYIRITSVGSSEIAFEIRLNSVISLIQIVWWRDWDSQLAFWLQQNLTGIKSNETRILYDKTDNRQYVS